MHQELFPPTLAAAQVRVAAIEAKKYASTRNFYDGAVNKISPYLTHGFINLADIAAGVEARYPAEDCEKLIMEFGWREFFQHVWRHVGDGILNDIEPGLPGVNYRSELPRDIIEARTGIAVIDATVRELYNTGYLHNHARMWLASYVVHLRKVHWRAGADWMLGYLLDGDPASNHLSWQWVAATFSSKPYLFNAENVARFAPRWASEKTAIDISYEALDAIARSNQIVQPEWRCGRLSACTVPPLFAVPKELIVQPDNAANAAPVLEFEVVLIHPWNLAEPQSDAVAEADAGADAVVDGGPDQAPKLKRIGVIHAPYHANFPWSEQRWQFVMTRMRAITDEVWIGDLNSLLTNHPNTTFHATGTYHGGYREALSAANVVLTPVRRFTADPEVCAMSFTRFWSAIGRQTRPAKNAKKWHKPPAAG